MTLNSGASTETPAPADVDLPRNLALKRCDDQVAWYTSAMNRSRKKHNLSQVSVALLGGITPVLVVLQLVLEQQKNLLTVLIALFPALAAIIAILHSGFAWKDNYVRFAHTAEALKSEKVEFLTRTTRVYAPSVTEQQALSNLVRRTEAITLQETADWRSRVEETADPQELLGVADDGKG